MNEDELAAFLEQLVADDAPAGDTPAGDAPADGECAPGPAPAADVDTGPAGPTGVPGTGTPEGATGAEGVRRLLGDPATWAEPPAAGADALVAAIRAELPQQAQPPAGAWGAPGTSGRQSRVPPRWSRPAQGTVHVAPSSAGRWGARQGVLLAVAAVALVVVGVVGGLAVGRDSDVGPATGGDEVALAGTDLEPQASGRARVEETGSGVEVWLDVSGLPPAAPGTYYQAWVKGDGGAVTIGTFHLREGDDPVILWSGVELDDYPTLTVTLQQEGAGAESSGQVVLTGDVGGAGEAGG